MIFERCVELQLDQRSAQWVNERSSRLTASKMSVLFGSPLQKNTLLRDLWDKKVTQIDSAALSWGRYHEPQAFANYQLGQPNVRTAGFLISTDLARVGCSPDGLVIEDGQILGGCELKCPYDPEVHIKHFRYGLPETYRWQVYGSLWVSGAKWWDFVSYDPRAPIEFQLFVQRVMPDIFTMRRLDSELREFHYRLTEKQFYLEKVKARSAILSGNIGTFLKDIV